MKGRHVVILVFVFGLSLMAILFRLLPSAKPAPHPPPAAAPAEPPKPVESYKPLDPQASGTLEVTVRSKGQPVSGAIVSFQGTKSFRLTTGVDGKCVTMADPGAWQIVARGRSEMAPAVKTTQVETGRTASVEFDLAAGVRIEGTVRDVAGNPVAGAKVQLDLQDPAYTTRTDASGRYALNNVSAEPHTLTASSERLRPQTLKMHPLTPGQTVTLDFTLALGATVAGRVVDESGAPVPRAMVTVRNEVARVVRTDDQGHFRAEGLGEESVTVSVSARGFGPAYERGVTPGKTDVTVRLARGATLMGSVDGSPPAFSVHVFRFDEADLSLKLVASEPFTSQSQGVFTFRDLAPGRYEVVVETADRRTPVPVAAQLQAAETVNIGLVLLGPK